MYFETLHRRLIGELNRRVRNGDFTELELAHLTGVSQPHVHNILKGARRVSTRVADQILRRLRLTVMDLLDPEDVVRFANACAQHPGKSRGPGGPYSPN